MGDWLAAIFLFCKDIYAELKASWGYRVVNALYLLALAALKVADWFIPSLSLKLRSVAPATILGWQSWLIIALIILLVGVVDGARRLRGKEQKDRLSTIEPTLHARPVAIRAERDTNDPNQIYQESISGALEVVTVEIENTIHHVDFKVADIKTVKAQMFFRSLKGSDKHDVIRGAWIDSYECWLDFRVGEPLKLIVAIKENDAVYAVQADYVDIEYDPEQTFDPKFKILTDASYNVMIQLISRRSDKTDVLVGRFSFKLTTNPSFEIKRLN